KFEIILQTQNELNIMFENVYSYGIPSFKIYYIFYELNMHYDMKEEYEFSIFSLLTDLYFIRRFIDKDYITNGIIYSGARHSSNYIYILSKYFDFDINNFFYLKENPDKLKNLIKKLNDPHDLDKYVWPKVLKQCSGVIECLCN